LSKQQSSRCVGTLPTSAGHSVSVPVYSGSVFWHTSSTYWVGVRELFVVAISGGLAGEHCPLEGYLGDLLCAFYCLPVLSGIEFRLPIVISCLITYLLCSFFPIPLSFSFCISYRTYSLVSQYHLEETNL
jgi:hypothetical protein